MLQVDWGALMTASRCSARRFGQAQGGLLLHACGTEVSERDSPSPLGSTIKPLYFPPTGDQSYVLGRLNASYAPSWHVKTNCLGLALEAWQCGIAPIKSQMRGNVPCSREGPHLQGELPAATCSPVARGRKKVRPCVVYKPTFSLSSAAPPPCKGLSQLWAREPHIFVVVKLP